MGDPALVQDLIFLFLMLIKEMRRRYEFKIFLRDLRDRKILLRSSASCYKKENVLWEWKVRVCIDREYVELVIAGWSKLKFYDFYNMKLEQVMKNLTCGDQQILLMMIWLILTRVEAEEITYERLGSNFSWTCFRRWKGGSVGGWWNGIYFFGWLLLGDSNAEKWGDHHKKKFFVNNSVETVISLK